VASGEGEALKRIGRYILNTLTLLSLVLCVMTLAAWLRSFWCRDELMNARRLSELSIVSDSGGIAWVRREYSPRFPAGAAEGLEYRPIYGWMTSLGGVPHGHFSRFDANVVDRPTRPGVRGTERHWRFIGAGWAQFRDVGSPIVYPASVSAIVLPYWVLFLITGLPLMPRVLSWRRAGSWELAGRCTKCGYDLRATPERCPECGAVAREVHV
jgi:hypothetical protein